jgi:hypothetical protein
MTAPYKILARIAELENEAEALHQSNREFWKHPDHSAEASEAFAERRKRMPEIQSELKRLLAELRRATQIAQKSSSAVVKH